MVSRPPPEPSESVARLALCFRPLRLARVDRDLDASILAAPGLRLVRRHRFRLTKPAGSDTRARYTLCGQVGGRGVSTALGQSEVVVISSNAVRVPDDQQLRTRILVEAGRQIPQVRARLGTYHVGVEVE